MEEKNSDKVTGKHKRDDSYKPYDAKIACVDNTQAGLAEFSSLVMYEEYNNDRSDFYNKAMIMARLLAPNESEQADWIKKIYFSQFVSSDVDNYVSEILRSFKDPNTLVSDYYGDNEVPILCYLAQTPMTDDCILALIQAGANLDLDLPYQIDAPYLVSLGIQGRFRIVSNLIEAGARANFDIDYISKLKEDDSFKEFLQNITDEEGGSITLDQARENLNITKNIYDQYMTKRSGELKNIDALQALPTDIIGMIGKFS